MAHNHHHHLNARLSEGLAGEALGTSKQNQAVSSVGQHCTQKYSHTVFSPFNIFMGKKLEYLSREAHENFYRNWFANQHFRTTGVDSHVTKTGIYNENIKADPALI